MRQNYPTEATPFTGSLLLIKQFLCVINRKQHYDIASELPAIMGFKFLLAKHTKTHKTRP